jgi:hypothetical protein
MKVKLHEQLLLFNLLTGTCGIRPVRGAHSSRYEFPEELLLGDSVAAHQVEGGWEEDGKKEQKPCTVPPASVVNG